MRAAAIALVLAAHIPKINDGLVSRALNFGWTGVDLFFVLSGFLIGSQVLQSLTKHDDSWLRKFYVRRLLRTLPPYFAVLAVYCGLASIRATAPPTLSFSLFTQNFGIPPTFTASWSLCVEEQFYLLFPLAALLLLRIRTVDALLRWLGLFLLGEAALRLAIWSAVRPDLLAEPQALTAYMSHLYYPTYARLDGIALGVALAALKCFHPKIWETLMTRANVLIIGAGAFMALAILALWRHYSLTCSTVGFTLLNLSFALLTAAAVSDKGWLAAIRVPGAGYLAAISYSAYLTHSLAIDLIGRLSQRWNVPEHSYVALALTMAAILLFAMLLHYSVEQPSLAIRDRLFRKRRPRVRVADTAPGTVDRLPFSREVTGS